MINKIKIMITDDHPIVRDGLTAILSTQDDFEVIGEACNGHEAIEKFELLRPDIILMDLEMPILDGIESIKKLMPIYPNIKIIVLTVFDTDERIINAIKAGASGYLIKDSPRDKIFSAIRLIYQGGSLINPLIVSKILNQVTNDSKILNHLTTRELEVLKFLADGLLNKQISMQLFITERTVKFHVSSIFTKLKATNRTEAVKIAFNQGLIKF